MGSESSDGQALSSRRNTQLESRLRTYEDAVNHFKKNDRMKVYDLQAVRALTLSWNCDGTRLACGAEKSVAVATLDSSYRVKDIFHGYGHNDQVDQVAFHRTNPNLVASASCDHTIRIWDIRQTRTHTKLPTKAQNLNVAWSPCGSYLLYGDKEDTISIVDGRSLKTVRVESFKEETNEFAFDPTGKFLFVALGGGKLNIYAMPEMKLLRSIQAHSPQATCMCVSLSPNGERLALGASDALCSLWDVKQLICEKVIGRMDYPLRSCSFSFDSQLLANASEDHFIDIAWSSTGERVCELRLNAETYSCAWHPYAYLLAFASAVSIDSRDRDMSVRLFGFSQ
ncbi:hypothetical protein AB6A40_001129 [Gnathostoma spinigerum]|uniref:Uncharacterized protein n=1 Tax=Gnathostoma spinigerum TaxID=75299 RepID=A0ABD6E3I1_9BILA